MGKPAPLKSLLLAAVALAAAPALAKDKPVSITPEEAVVRRISADQYRAIIHDIFGPTIDVGGRFEPGLKVGGLAAAGSSTVGVTPAGMEQYDAMARSIADQVVGPAYRDQMIPCAPSGQYLTVTASGADAAISRRVLSKTPAADDACARAFLADVGRLLYRRPLTSASLDAYVSAAHTAAESTRDFYTGLALSLAGMLSSPQFLFRDVELEADPDNKGGWRLDSYSKASQLSFFLWNAGPDLQLLAAAGKGELETRKGLAKQVDRMMASPRLEAGLRAFFADHFAFDEFAELTKDAVLFPKFSAEAARDAQEQTLKTVVALLLKDHGDYRDLFTTRKTFLTPELGAIYQVPIVDDRPTGTPDSWTAYEFPADDHRAGILTHVSFTALHSPAGRGSPTIRGKALREVILCQKVPPPPGNVPFNVVQDTSNPLYRTARDRLTAHRTNPVCAGCHKIMDPLGLALETFDGAGEYRTTENGKAIDTSGELDGVSFADAEGLGKAVHDNPATPSCLVDRMASYALGHLPTGGEAPWVTALQKSFADHGYRVPDLMREIAVSDAFYQRALPKTAVAAVTDNAQQDVRK